MTGAEGDLSGGLCAFPKDPGILGQVLSDHLSLPELSDAAFSVSAVTGTLG